MKSTFSIAIHGGAGTIRKSEMTDERKEALNSSLVAAISQGVNILEQGGSALDASVAAVVEMENSPLFNAGTGSVFNSKGFIEMDAAVMCGKDLQAGAVTCVKKIKNPILAAKSICQKSHHILLSSEGAEEFAKQSGLEMATQDYFYTEFRHDQLLKAQKQAKVQLDHVESNDGKFGTVGAVALDKSGNLAAATSTGGMTNQLAGRVGDTPLIGCGTYANNQTCAVSCTGIGESFVRGVSAFDVSALIEYRGISLEDACNRVIHQKLPKVKGQGGLIAVDRNGSICLSFNSEGMYRAWCREGERLQIRMYSE